MVLKRILNPVFVTVFALAFTVSAIAADGNRVIVSTSGSRADLRATIQRLGGRITQEFQNVNAVAAVIPESARLALDNVSEFKVSKDTAMRLTPPVTNPRAGRSEFAVQPDGVLPFEQDEIAKFAGAQPADYTFNNSLINAASVQAGGNFGQDVVVAVIDSGTANYSGVAALTGTVIGGENFSGDSFSATSRSNGPHGTWVGTMIAGHAKFLFSKTGCLGPAVAYNAPGSVEDGANYGQPDYYVIPMTGVAPGAKIYALKVFPADEDSTSSSNIIAAMDRAITLKKNYLAHKSTSPVSGTGTEDDPYVYNALNIQVVNMSLGGPTLIAGRDVEDQLVQQMLDLGITVAISAGNAGPSGLTTGSPSTSFASISTAAATTPTHERIYWDANYCSPGLGELVRPTNIIQTALFSSRGPTADGRIGVGVTTAGDWNLAQGADGGVYLVSGTSFSAPTVAGAAALIRKAVPKATAAQVRNAIILAANSNMLGDNSTVLDQGAGYLDVANTIKYLKTRWVPDWVLPSIFPSSNVADNLYRLFLRTSDLNPGRSVNGAAKKLKPGERSEFFIEVDKDIASITLNINKVTPTNAPANQNQVFGDDLILNVHSAKTSSFGEGDYVVPSQFLAGPASFTIPNPESGVIRVTLVGDWTNAGTVSADFTATATKKPKATFSKSGKVAEGDTIVIPFNVPAGKAEADFELTWKHDWASYPTNDLDLIVVAPDGTPYLDGATLNGLERVAVTNPAQGQWQILVNGFTIYDPIGFDRWKKSKKDNTDSFQVNVFLK